MNVFDNGSYNHYEFVQQNGKMIAAESQGRLKAARVSQNISPTGSVGNVFINGNSNLSYLLPIGNSNLCDVCDSIIVELTLQNNDAVNAATILAGQFLLTNIQTLTSGVIEQSYPENQMVKRLFLANNDEEIFQRATMEQFAYGGYPNAYTTSATTIAASGSRTIYLQIFTCIDTCKLFLPAITQQITLQLYFNSTAVTSASASTNVTLSSSRLIMHGWKYDNQIRVALLQRFMNQPHFYKYCISQREILSNITVSNVSESNFQVSAFSGFKLPALFVLVRAANATQENLYTFDRIGTLDERINGSSVYTSKLNYDEFANMAIECGIKTSVPMGNTDILMLPHSVNVYESLKHNKCRGYQLYNPNVNLLIQMDSVAGNRDLVALAQQDVAVKIQNGALTIEYL